MRRISSTDCVSGQPGQITPETRIVPLEQIFNACILEEGPKILYEPWLRIQTKQVTECDERSREGLAIATTDTLRHISQHVHPKPVRAELQMSGFVRSHDEIQPLVLFRRGIPPQ